MSLKLEAALRRGGAKDSLSQSLGAENADRSRSLRSVGASSSGARPRGGVRQALVRHLASTRVDTTEGATQIQEHQGQDSSQRFRALVKSMDLRNKWSALDTQTVASAGKETGARSLADLKGGRPKNAQRGLTRCLLKISTAPDVYWAEIPTSCPSSGADRVMTAALQAHPRVAFLFG